jgi:hypothetical protein
MKLTILNFKLDSGSSNTTSGVPAEMFDPGINQPGSIIQVQVKATASTVELKHIIFLQ